ncbi:MAG: hypothetical protein M1818_007828 [Claussenomyces sp. TS43310]|nr:MAG: hypothetical protein M1818_007828 [Claussenomyces sp. TS43310]
MGADGYRAVAYFVNHYPTDSWNDVGTNLYGCLKQLYLLKKRHRQLKVLLSIGGWTYSANFAPAAATAAGRAQFASSAVSLVKNLGFDGLDIDWEYPKDTTEAANLVLLLQECRAALDAYGASLPTPHHFELSVACPAGRQNYEKMDLPGMDRYLDFWNLMAYDFAGSWDATAGHQANLFPSRRNPASTPFSAVAAVAHYTTPVSHHLGGGGGIAPDKLVLGMPLYGRAFENTDGPGCAYQGVGPGTWETGVHDFKTLPPAGAREHLDAETGAAYSYDAQSRTLVSYDTLDVARLKADWIRHQRLGGAMWWESSADAAGPRSLIAAVVGVLSGAAPGLQTAANCLEYPESRYDNLRKGFPGE